jgi:tRNA(Ile)-lysidine synthetase-like protein
VTEGAGKAADALRGKVSDFLSRHRSIDPERSFVAYSGGMDSSALLDVLTLMGMKPARAIYIDHNLRTAEELAREWEAVQAFCAERTIPLARVAIESGAVLSRAREGGIGVEAAAREYRYRLLAREAALAGCPAVLTAHHEDDLLETLLFRMFRGSGVDGLGGMAEARSLSAGVELLRPFLAVKRSLIEAYAAERGLGYVEDSTNAGDEYARNHLRHRLVPVLDAGFPGWRRGLLATGKALRADARALGEAAAAFIEESGTGCPSVSFAAFREAGPELQNKILGCLLSSSGSSREHSRAALASLAESLSKGSGELRFRGRRLRVCAGRLESLPALDFEPEHGYFFMIASAGVYQTGSLGIEALWSSPSRVGLPSTEVDADRGCLVEGSFDFPLVVRTRMPGDRIGNEAGSSMVDDLLKSWKIEPGLRGTVPIVEDTRGIVAVLPGSMEIPPTDRELHRNYSGPLSGRRLFIRVKGA